MPWCCQYVSQGAGLRLISSAASLVAVWRPDGSSARSRRVRIPRSGSTRHTRVRWRFRACAEWALGTAGKGEQAWAPVRPSGRRGRGLTYGLSWPARLGDAPLHPVGVVLGDRPDAAACWTAYVKDPRRIRKRSQYGWGRALAIETRTSGHRAFHDFRWPVRGQLHPSISRHCCLSLNQIGEIRLAPRVLKGREASESGGDRPYGRLLHEPG